MRHALSLFVAGLILLSSSLNGKEESYLPFELYRDGATQWLFETTDALDLYIAGSETPVDSNRNTYIDASFKTIAESNRQTRYYYGLSAYFDLPRIQKKINLVVEEFRADDSVDTGTNPSHSEAIGEGEYLVGIQYGSFFQRHLNINGGAGARFTSNGPRVYLNLTLSRQFNFTDSIALQLRNRFYYFNDGHSDNRFSITFSRILSESTLTEFFNGYRYQSDRHSREYTTRLLFYKILTVKNGLVYEAAYYSSGDDTHKVSHRYSYAGASFRHMIYKNWVYYEITPSVIWRDERDFKPSPQFSFKLGIIFGNKIRYNFEQYRRFR